MASTIDPDLDGILDLLAGENHPCQAALERGAELGLIWAHLFQHGRDEISHRTPVHEDNLLLCEQIAGQFGWVFATEPQDPEWVAGKWHHGGEDAWTLGRFYRP